MLNRNFLLLSLLLVSRVFAIAQTEGCTDPQAINYNPQATVNNGSCLYPQTNITPETIVSALPQEVIETSGLIWWNGGLWTHKDSGNPPILYKLDSVTGAVLQTIAVTGAENVDWEDITQDETHIYIGDFGNNLGNRTDLKIYITNKSDYPLTGNGSVPASIIDFNYGDQQNFERANRSNDYDCEAMISMGDSLIIFTKNWLNEQSRMYFISKIPGNYTIYPSDTLAADGLITGADIMPGNSEVILCGYKNYNPFIWLLYDFDGNNLLGGNKRRIGFNGMLGTQTEGVAYTFGNNVYISSEKTSIAPARLFRINTAAWTQPIPTGIESNESDQEITVLPNPNNGRFSIDFGGLCQHEPFSVKILNAAGKRVKADISFYYSACRADVKLLRFNNGVYFISFSNDQKQLLSKIIVRK